MAATMIHSTTPITASLLRATPTSAEKPQPSSEASTRLIHMQNPAASQGDPGAIPSSCPVDVSRSLVRDGRIRDPIPRRLKGKTDQKSGQFSVMHIEMENKQQARERDAAAKRTSECTVLAAKKAEEEGYRPLRRKWPSQSHATGPDSDLLTMPPPCPLPFEPPTPRPSRPYVPRAGPLTSDEARSEMSRLVALLRTLSPALIVDRLCSAIGFFGGSCSEAQSPASDSVFPQSAEGNGQGSLFVGWMSEIFPPLDPNAPRPRGGVLVNGVLRRPRGRPRGSKTRNKGATGTGKAGKHKLARTDPDRDQEGTAVCSNLGTSSISVLGATAPDLDTTSPASQSRQALQVPASSVEIRPPAPVPGSSDSFSHTHPRPSVALQSMTITPLSGEPPPVGVTPPMRRRGRPKGSRNKPKRGPQDSARARDNTNCEEILVRGQSPTPSNQSQVDTSNGAFVLQLPEKNTLFRSKQNPEGFKSSEEIRGPWDHTKIASTEGIEAGNSSQNSRQPSPGIEGERINVNIRPDMRMGEIARKRTREPSSSHTGGIAQGLRNGDAAPSSKKVKRRNGEALALSSSVSCSTTIVRGREAGPREINIINMSGRDVLRATDSSADMLSSATDEHLLNIRSEDHSRCLRENHQPVPSLFLENSLSIIPSPRPEPPYL